MPSGAQGIRFNCCSVVFNSLQPHRLQHVRLPCPSLTLRVYSNSCPLNWWCHSIISSSVNPFSSCLQFFPVVMYGCDSWTIKMAEHWRTDAFKLLCWRRSWEPLDCKEIKPGNPKGNQPWIFIRTDAETEAQYFSHLMQRANSLEKFAGKDWRQEEKGLTEDEMVGWHRQLNGHEFK